MTESSRGAVLLVDDSVALREITAAVLEDLGYTVRQAGSGAEALEALGGDPPDIVVCDLHMPGMDGYQFLRSAPLRDGRLPVIILSSEDDLDAVLEAVHEGAFDYVVKDGADHGRLVAAVDRAVDHSRVVQENQRLSAELAARLVELQREVAVRARTEEALRQAHDAALSASRAKSSFLANMSHELRTPLNAILGYTELLLEEGLTSAVNDDLRKVRTAGTHLLGLINDILDLSKVEAGRMAFAPRTIPVKDLVQAVVTTARPLMARNRNALAIRLVEPLGSVTVDPQRLEQILLNLLGNAAKFTSEGTVTFRAERVHADDRDWLELAVADTGVGMSAEQCARIFEDFVQADATTSRKFGGTGLGLAISRRLCTLMGGSIAVASEPGRGSVFTVRLPAEAIRSPAFGVVPADAVLVIDDDAETRDLIARILEAEGFPVVLLADSAHDGLDLALKAPPRLITLDLLMPGMDGWRTLELIQATPSLSRVPVLVISSDDDRDRGLALGAAEHLVKPILRDALIEAVHRLAAR